MKKSIGLFLALFLMLPAGAFAETFTGVIVGLNPQKNTLYLSQRAKSGRAKAQKFVWDDVSPSASALEEARIGQRLSIEAYRRFFKWKVRQAAPAEDPSAPKPAVVPVPSSQVLTPEAIMPAPPVDTYVPAEPVYKPVFTPPAAVVHKTEACSVPAIVAAATPQPVTNIRPTSVNNPMSASRRAAPQSRRSSFGSFLAESLSGAGRSIRDGVNGAARSVDDAFDSLLRGNQ